MGILLLQLIEWTWEKEADLPDSDLHKKGVFANSSCQVRRGRVRTGSLADESQRMR